MKLLSPHMVAVTKDSLATAIDWLWAIGREKPTNPSNLVEAIIRAVNLKEVKLNSMSLKDPQERNEKKSLKIYLENRISAFLTSYDVRWVMKTELITTGGIVGVCVSKSEIFPV